jgi:hypothetical protein
VVDGAQPEASHGVVVAIRTSVVRGEVANPAGHRIRGLFQTEQPNLDPGQPQMISMMKGPVSDLTGIKVADKRSVFGGHFVVHD